MKEPVKLLYIEEHQGCNHYIKENNVGFKRVSLTKDESMRISLGKEFVVMFVTKGSLKVRHGAEKIQKVATKEICLLSNFRDYQLKASSDTEMTCLYFDRPHSRCDLLSFEKMIKQVDKTDGRLARVLSMKKPVNDFVVQMQYYIDNKMFCRHLHDIKESEFIFLMRSFYSKEEIRQFFAPVVIALNDFNNLVRANYLKAKNVNELAGMCFMTPKTFTRRFKDEFGDTPKQWMIREKSKYNKKPIRGLG